MSQAKQCIRCGARKPGNAFAESVQRGPKAGRICLSCVDAPAVDLFGAWVASVLADRNVCDGDDLLRPVKDTWGRWHYPARGGPVIERNVG